MIMRTTPSDEELIRAAQGGSQDAFTSLYERHLPTVFRRVRYRIPEHAVEDVTQEVFIAVMKSLKNFRFESQFKTWLCTLTNRQIADYYRRRNQPEAELDLEILISKPEEISLTGHVVDVGDMDDTIILRQALRDLPEHYREILMLRFVDGLQFNEIAEMQRQTLDATKSLFRRAVAQLQKQVSHE